MFHQIGDHNVLCLAAELFNGCAEQVMRQRTRRDVSLDSAINAHRLKQTDQNREGREPPTSRKKTTCWSLISLIMIRASSMRTEHCGTFE